MKTAFLITASYFLASFYFTNPSLINNTLVGSYTFFYKINILEGLLLGLPQVMGEGRFLLLIFISILTGINLALLLRRFKLTGANSNLLMGGSTLGFTTASCASCGVPILGVLGISGSMVQLPFKGLELSVLALGLLVISSVILHRQNSLACKIDSRR